MVSKKFIVIEGIDATGKSTVADLIDKMAVFKVLKMPPSPFDTIKQHVIEKKSAITNFFFFMAANAEISSEVQKLEGNQNVLCVRYIWSTMAYHIALEAITRNDAENIWKAISGKFILPSLMIFFRVNETERLRRFQSKDEPRFQANLGMDLTFQSKLTQEYDFVKDLIRVPVNEIETSYMSPNIITNKIISAITES